MFRLTRYGMSPPLLMNVFHWFHLDKQHSFWCLSDVFDCAKWKSHQMEIYCWKIQFRRFMRTPQKHLISKRNHFSGSILGLWRRQQAALLSLGNFRFLRQSIKPLNSYFNVKLHVQLSLIVASEKGDFIFQDSNFSVGLLTPVFHHTNLLSLLLDDL